MRAPLIRYLPKRLQESLLYRWYYPVQERWLGLFAAAQLRLAPSVKMRLLATDLMHASIAFTGMYEADFSRHVCELSSSTGGVMVDVGANAGYFSLLWAAANPQSTCMAFEPSPRNIDLLKENIKTNRMEGRIELKDIALGREVGEFAFDLGPEEQTGWGGLVLGASNRSIKVAVKRLDDVIPADMMIDLLKIDTEGADTWVLQGSESLLRQQRIREIHYEQNKTRLHQLGIAEDEAAQFLASVGYVTKATSATAKDIVDWVAVPA